MEQARGRQRADQSATDLASVARARPFSFKYLNSLKPDPARRYEVVEPGRTNVRVLVTPKGTKTLYYVYKHRGERIYLRLARFTKKIDMAAVRARAREFDEQRDQGIDPRGARRAARQKAAAALTVRELAGRYVERYAKQRKRTWREDERMLARDVLPAWGDRPAAEIQRSDVRELLERIVDRGAPVAANRTLALLRVVFGFALDQDVIQHNPCERLRMPSAERAKDRWLDDAEIGALWCALRNPLEAAARRDWLASPALQQRFPVFEAYIEDEIARTATEERPAPAATSTALALALVTGQRVGEIVGMEWRELDLIAAWWTLPAARSKSKREHRIPLSALALALLGELGDGTRRAGFVFPVRGKKRAGHLRGNSVDHALGGLRPLLQVDGEPLRPFSPHDLRRTVATHLARLGVSRLTISKVLNHSEGGVTSIYDRHAYETEKRAALDQWAAHLVRITGATLPASADSGAVSDETIGGEGER